MGLTTPQLLRKAQARLTGRWVKRQLYDPRGMNGHVCAIGALTESLSVVPYGVLETNDSTGAIRSLAQNPCSSDLDNLSMVPRHELGLQPVSMTTGAVGLLEDIIFFNDQVAASEGDVINVFERMAQRLEYDA